MALQLATAVSRGLRRSLSGAGAVLMALTFGYVVLFVGAINTIVAGFFPPELVERAEFGVVFPLSTAVAGALAVVSFLVGAVVYLAATRILSRDPGSASLSATPFTRRIVPAVLTAVVVNVVTFVAVSVGFVFLFVPGLFLAVSFAFALFAVGVEDAGPVAALRRSWDLASGNRWRVLALLVAVGLVVGLTTGLVGAVGALAGVDSAAVQTVTLALSSVLTVLSYGILADAFVQLGGGRPTHSLA